MSSKLVCIYLIAVTLFTCLTGPACLAADTQKPKPESEVRIAADFSKWADYPLSKTKFAVYNSGLVPLPHYDRDIHLFDEVKPNSLRIDLWWGGGPWSPQPVSGTANDIRYHFEQMDHIAHLLNAHHVRPCWAYSYVPPPVQPRPSDWRRITDARLWGTIVGTFARHALESGLSARVGYHEIYNEPDNRDFFRGSRDDYFAMYREGSRAIRTADPDAVIGGPALAFTPEWVDPFLAMVEDERLPLNFFSFHFYPRCWGTNNIRDVVLEMRKKLASHPELATTEMHLNEFNSLPIDYPRGGPQDRYGIASAMLTDYEWFLAQPDLTQVSWAQFQDTAGGNWSGMISFEGKRKALFNAMAIYARMPGDRRQVSVQGAEGVRAMASANEERASLLIWNRSGAEKTVEASMPHIPFRRGKLRVYRIDAEHCSWGDNPENERLVASEQRTDIRTRSLKWTGNIPEGAVVYLEVDNEKSNAKPKPLDTTTVVRLLNYFPDRHSRAYADFDCREWVARLGMGEELKALAQVGVVAENLPQKMRVRVQTDGDLRKIDENSLLGLRLDYQVGTNYTHSILFHRPGLYDPDRNAPVPYGTRSQAHQVVAVREFAQFYISPAEFAPAGWTGRAEITLLMQNTGRGSRARISLAAD